MNNESNNKMVIAVIIPVFNGIYYTKTCLKSLYRLTSSTTFQSVDFQIVVIDDGSQDGTDRWVKENYPSVHLLYGDGTLWWSGGINRGSDYALNMLDAEYVLWWNNDIQPANDYFYKAAEIIESVNSDVLIGSKIFVLNQNKIWGMGGRFDASTGRRYMYGEQTKDDKAYGKPIEVDWFPGMGTFLHRSVFNKIGFLDEKNFPQYHGDSDYTYRAKKAGFKLIAFPQLIIYNDNTNTGLKHGGSANNLYKSLTSIKSNYNLKKDIAFYRKHANSPLAYILLFNKYLRYVGGFYKWKLLNSLGVNKSLDEQR